MEQLRRIYLLHQILVTCRKPVSLEVLKEKLGCSRPTVNRIIRDMRLYFNAPLEYDRENNGYYYDSKAGEIFELPGLWLAAGELQALTTVQQLLEQAQPGLLDIQLKPLKERIAKLLASEHLGGGEIAKRVHILRMAGRRVSDEIFQAASGALLQRKRLRIRYRSREAEQETLREISPQRLIHYRDNWYLDAWCHTRQALRSFAVERISTAQTLDQAADDTPEEELDAHFASSYGIFAGRQKHIAILRFTANRARWVADEHWHPQQESRFLEDGSYELRIPYSDPRELVMDILKFGPDVEVMEPEELRRMVVEKLRGALEVYEKN